MQSAGPPPPAPDWTVDLWPEAEPILDWTVDLWPEAEPADCTWETCSHWDDCFCPATPCVDWLGGWRPDTFCLACLGLGADVMYCVGS